MIGLKPRNYAAILHKNLKISNLHLHTTRFNSSFVLDPGYQPSNVENRQRKNVLNTHSSKKSDKTFSMIFPPPNVTGYIHLGHALTATVQDVISRHRRKQGEHVVWIPGTDHAGIATQTVVEKALAKERNVTRHDLGRERFLDEVWKWKEARSDKTKEDLLRLGATMDWNEEYFTMNKTHSWAVRETFIRLFNKSLVYRDEALVNWSCALESAISDIEVENVEFPTPRAVEVPGYKKKITFGQIYDIAYRTEDGEELIVATTRPETLLGDAAIAVHPEDSRYSGFHGAKCVHPFRSDAISVVTDTSVDREFGTGAVKITPAHDKNDFVLGKQHRLKSVAVIDEKGRICDGFEGFSGLQRFDAREKILTELANRNLLKQVRPHAMSVPVCSRSKDVIEFLIRPQWFVNCKEMSRKALEAVQTGKIRLNPENFHHEWERWLTDCRDWCISRQLWWGHRIPAYLCQNRKTNEEKWMVAHSVHDLQLTSDWTVTQDEDVLDTWFSSALLPFSLNGWPNINLQRYPLNLMETGHDIIFFWVARMVMLGLELTDEIPFKEILLHGIICDAQGRKMSKSLGNVITPEYVIDGISLDDLKAETEKSFQLGTLSKDELDRTIKAQKKMFPKGIPECGTDALRFTLCSHNIKNHFINFDVTECHTNKLFFNKIWQATRYTVGFCEKQNLDITASHLDPTSIKSKMDLWILSRLVQTQRQVETALTSYNFHLATAALKTFFYQNFCDVYLETTKRNQLTATGNTNCTILAACLSRGLDLMEPFTPFLSHDLKQTLPTVDVDFSHFENAPLEQEVAEILDVCVAVRQQKSVASITKRHNPVLVFQTMSETGKRLLEEYKEDVKALTFSTDVLIDCQRDGEPIIRSTAGSLCSFEVYADVESSKKGNEMNLKKLTKLEAELNKLFKIVKNQGYKESATKEIQNRHSERIKAIQIEMKNIQSI